MTQHTVTIRNTDTGEALHARIAAASPMLAVHYADQVPLADWISGPAPSDPVEVFTLQCFDHGVEVDSNWSSLELAQLAAVTITTETTDGANEGLNPQSDDVKATLQWEHQSTPPLAARHWRATSPENVGFVITRTTLNTPYQF